MDAYGLLTLPGHVFFHFLSYLGQLAALASELMIALRSGVWRLKLVAQQIVAIGYGSQGVVIVTGAFTGAVFTFQSYAKFKEFGFETTVGAVVSVALCRELGPVLAGLMVAGRVGAAMAADIGTMKVTEQVDALRVMGVHLDLSGLWRRKQIRALLAAIDASPRYMPTIMMGDFNQWSDKGALSELAFHHHRLR